MRGRLAIAVVFVAACSHSSTAGDPPSPSSGPGTTTTLAPLDASPLAAPLVVVPSKRLTAMPDAFEPSGRRIGVRHGDRCDVWDVAQGAYRGDFARAVCDEWMTHVGHGGGLHVRSDGSAVVVERDSGGFMARFEDCWTKPKALSVSPGGRFVAAVCASQLMVWPTKGGKVSAFDDPPLEMDRDWTVAFTNEELVSVATHDAALDHATSLEGGGVSDFDAKLVTYRLANRMMVPDSAGFFRLDPFGHVVLRANAGCGEDCFEEARIDALDGRTIELEWTPFASQSPLLKPPPFTPQMAEDGSACLVRSYAPTSSGSVPSAQSSFVATDGSDPTSLAGTHAVLAPNGRRAASFVDGIGRRLEIVSLRPAGPPTTRTIDVADGAKDAVFSPDATAIAVSFPDHVAVYDAESGHALVLWEGASHPAFAKAAPGALFAQVGGAVVRRSVSGPGAPWRAEGRMLEGSLVGGKPLFVYQDGTVSAFESSGTKVGSWKVEGATTVSFGQGGVAAVRGARAVSVVSLGKSEVVAWKLDLDPAERVDVVGREVRVHPKKGPARRYDVETGASLGDVTEKVDGTLASPDGRFSCGDVVTRKDGATLTVIAATAVVNGQHQGNRFGADAFVLRSSVADPIDAPLLRAGSLPETPTLIADFFSGASLDAPSSSGTLPELTRFAAHADKTQHKVVEVRGRGEVRVWEGAAIVARFSDDAPHTMVFGSEASITAEACVGDVCSSRKVLQWEGPALLGAFSEGR